ncbi:hypothetical protein ACFLYP_03595 [Chloroflexota bacterium]
MISTVVTTSTVSTVTATAITGSLALVGVFLLLALLIQKDATSAGEDKRTKRFNQALNIALPPLLVAFIVVAIVKISELIR